MVMVVSVARQRDTAKSTESFSLKLIKLKVAKQRFIVAIVIIIIKHQLKTILR